MIWRKEQDIFLLISFSQAKLCMHFGLHACRSGMLLESHTF